MNVTVEVMETVAQRMSGTAGLDGVDTTTIQDWLLRYGQTSKRLRESLTEFARWIENTFPSWSAIRAFVCTRLIGLDKCPGVRPVRIGGILLRLVGKAILAICRQEVQDACG
eukprot:12236569-Ditylum_brightwellii.AAC.1